MKIFNGHMDLWEDVDEKRRRGLNHIINSFHMNEWNKGGICGGFYPVWINFELNESYEQQFFHIIENINLELKCSYDEIQVVRNYYELIKAIDSSKHAIILGTEGLSFIGSNYRMIDLLYLAGFKIMSLTWNEDNELACGAGTTKDQGLTIIGKKAVKKINSLGIIMDLAHTSEKTFWDILKIADKPCTVSHGNSRKLCQNPRNYSDEQLRAIRDLKGVIGVSAYGPYVDELISNQDVEHLINHVSYIADLVGIDYVGFGFDLVDYLDDKGIDPSLDYDINGFEGIGKAQILVESLENRGYSRDEIEKVCYKNYFRLIKDVLR